jgi:hypothetical protein
MVDIDPIQAWKEKKWSLFSASEEWKLTIPGKEDKKLGIRPMFGETGMTYIKKIARQAITQYNDEDQPETYAMKLGKAKEPDSFAYLCKMLGRFDIMEYYGGHNPLFELYTPDSGTSPDAVAWKDKTARIASFGCELKNPSGDTHFDYLMNIKNQETLKSYCPEYYTQVQKAMMTFKTDLWLWCSHNEYFKGRDRLLVIEVREDKNFQNDLDARIAAATKKKYEFIEQLKNRL